MGSEPVLNGFWFTACLTPTDAGFIIMNPPYKYQLYAPRGYGFYGDITGAGQLLAAVQPDVPASPPYPGIMAALGQEQINTWSADIKNAAVFTPLKGTLASALNYFQSTSSPIQHTCQRNFIMLVTDGTPTGDEYGNLYSNQDRVNTYDGTNWSFGPASSGAIQAVTNLRTASFQSNAYDIQTYVIGLGDTVQNASAVATLNAMAAAGGTTSAFLAQNETQLLKAIDGVAQDIIAKDGAAAAVTVSNPNIVAGDNASYTSTYNSGTWTGDLQSYPVNLTTGVIDTTSPNWASSAQAQLDNTIPSGRNIVTYDGTHGIQFRPSADTTATKLTAAQEAIFASPVTPPGPADGPAVVAYMRGDRTNEGTLYRTRAHLLGDLVDAEPLLVRAPSQNYADTVLQPAGSELCDAVPQRAGEPSARRVPGEQRRHAARVLRRDRRRGLGVHAAARLELDQPRDAQERLLSRVPRRRHAGHGRHRLHEHARRDGRRSGLAHDAGRRARRRAAAATTRSTSRTPS